MDRQTDNMAAQLRKNKDLLERVVRSDDAQRLMELLNRKAGGGLKEAADAAVQGDPTALLDMVRQVMGTQEGAKLVERLNQTAPKS